MVMKKMKRLVAWMMVILMLGQMLPGVSFAASPAEESGTELYETVSAPEEKPVYHTVTFTCDGEEVTAIFVKDGASIQDLPEAPAIQGKAFLGWYDGNQVFSQDTAVYEDKEIRGAYREVDEALEAKKRNADYIFSDAGAYVTVEIFGTHKKNQVPSTAKASISSEKNVADAWNVSNLKNNTDLTVEAVVTAAPAEGVLFAYSVNNGSLGKVLGSNLSIGDRIVTDLAMKGFAGIAFVIEPETTEEDEEAEEETDGALYANEDFYISGKIPGNGIIEVIPATIEIDGEETIAAYDINIYANAKQQEKGKTWQPAGKKVQVHWRDEAFQGELHVYHVNGDQPELMDTVTPTDGWVSFEADSFSVYAVTETILNKTVTTSDGATYDIQVTYQNTAGIPMKGTELSVSEILPTDAAYASYIEETAKKIGAKTENIEFARAFDIKIVDAGDQTRAYEPTGNVDVSIRLIGANLDSYANVEVLHFADTAADSAGSVSTQSLRLMSASDTSNIDELKTSVNGETVAFTTDGFSVFVVAGYVLEKEITASDGLTYRITVEYDDHAGIPGDAELKVEEVSEEVYAAYLAEAVSTLGADIHSISYGKLFDISIVKDGTEYQPNENVKVTVALLDAVSVDQVQVVHFEDEDTASALTASTDGSTVTFETDSFSVFSFLDFSLLDRIVSAVIGEKTGTLYENDDIILTGSMPALGIVEAERVDVEIPGVDTLVAYDIKIYSNSFMKLLGINWQPSTPVSVTVKSDAFQTNVVSVYHMETINDAPELIAEDVEVGSDRSVTFDAQSFSIYPIGEEGNERLGYRFWYYDGASGLYKELGTQFFRYKDVAAGMEIYEPSIPGISQEDFVTIFEGWHKGTVNGSTADLEDAVVTIEELNTDLKTKVPNDYNETITEIIAALKDAYYITYVDVNTTSVLATELVAKSAEGDTTFTVKSSVKTTQYEEDLKGWRQLEEIANSSAQLYEANSTYVITENITLAPVIEGGYWLMFDDNDLVDDGTGNMVSGGASYTPPAFYMNNDSEQQVTVRPVTDPEWEGYEFVGWYEDAACTTEYVFGEVLTTNVTIYAKWIPGDSSYTVVIWKQPTNPNATSYDFAQSFAINTGVKTGDLVYLDNQYTQIYGEDGTSDDLDKQYFTYNEAKTDQYIVVKANGSSVFNVYYDRVPMTITFYTWGSGYVYMETTSESGIQYGIVDGEYVQLTHKDGEEEVYNYAYSPTYTVTTGDLSDQYGIVDGEYVLLDKEQVVTWRPNYIYTLNTAGTGSGRFGVVDGEFVPLSYGYRYYYNRPVYTYTATTSNSGTQYGLVGGEYVLLYRVNGRWYDENWNQYTGPRYIRTQTGTETVNYSGTLYYYNDGWFNSGYYEYSGTDNGTQTLYAYDNGEFYQVSRTGTYWYVDSTGAEFTGNRYTRTNGSGTYTGTRYTRSGSSAPYTYTETVENTGTQYGVTTSDNGHVELTRNVNSYAYLIDGEEYTGIRYVQSSANPVTYTGTRYTKDNGVYHVTESNAVSGLYGKDGNGAWRPLTATVSHPSLWVYYTQEEGGTVVEHSYTGTRYTRSSNTANSWQLYKQFVGVYGATLAEYGYEWPKEYNWYEYGGKISDGGNANSYVSNGRTYNLSSGSTGGSRMTLKTTFEPLEGELDVKFYGNDPSTSGASIIFLKQQLDGTYVQADEIKLGSNSGSFHINDKYTGFEAAQYSTNGGTSWTNVTPKGSDGYYGSAVSYTSNGLRIRFNRKAYDLVFFPDPATGAAPITYSLPYETDLNSYSNQSAGQKDGYYFEDWYTDDAFTTEFNFDQTMPDHSVSVYGNWRMIRTRVIFVPGAENVHIDPGQAMSFRLNYDERLDGSLVNAATRVGYTLDGWYTDPSFTNKFIFTTPVRSDTTGVDPTYQTAAKWEATRASYGDNTAKNENVRNILILYAKWILNTSEKGVNVIYDAGEGALYDGLGNLTTQVPVDHVLYQTGSDIMVSMAPTGYNTDLFDFKYLEAIDSNGNVLKTSLYPGSTFNESEVEAYAETRVPETDEVILKIMKLRAVYDRKQEAADRYTTITYDGDTFDAPVYPSGTEEMKGITRDGTQRYTVTLDKQINTTIVLPDADDFYLDGYTLVGWSFFEGDYDSQISQARTWNAGHTTDGLDLPEQLLPGAQVAADNVSQSDVNDEGNTLYAMWQPKTYTVTVKQVIESGVPVNAFTYSYKAGVENTLGSASTSSLRLTGNSSQVFDSLTTDSGVKMQYYGRLGHVFNIPAPTISETADYAVRVSATVTRDDGTKESLDLNENNNYEILGDVEITFTYSLKVPVTLKKQTLNDKTDLPGAKFVLTPVSFNSETQRWEQQGSTTFEYDLTASASKTLRLQEGSYRVHETLAPENYASMSEDVLLTVHKNAAFTLTNLSGQPVSENVAILSGSGENQILTIYDRPIRTVTVQKIVEGKDYYETDGYTVTAEIFLEGSALSNYDTGNGTTNSAGIMQFQVKAGEPKALNIPWDSVITLTETEYTQYATAVNAVQTGTETEVEDKDTESDLVFRCQVDENVTVAFTNSNKTLTVKKTVSGDFGDRTFPFSFKISCLTASRQYRMILLGETVTRTASADGEISFNLKHDEEMSIALPKGTKVTVSETPVDSYTTTFEVGEDEAETVYQKEITIAEDDVKVTVNNDRPAVAPTGVRTTIFPFVIMLVFGLILGGGLYYGKRRKGGEE